MARTTFYQKNFIGWPPVHVSEIANPDSGYWHEQADDALYKLKLSLGEAQYGAWMKVVWPVIRFNTWAAIAKTAEKALADCAAGVNVVGLARSYIQNSMKESE